MGIYVPWLGAAAQLTGYPVVEVAGWRDRGRGPMRAVEGVAAHHTANPAAGDYPSLRIVRDGRAGLAGPLSHLGLGRSGTVYVIAAGLCWHAGASAWAGFYDLNSTFLGVEAESAGTVDDWTPEQRDCYPRLIAALLHYMRRDASRVAFHKEICLPRGRKIDAAYWDGPLTRSRVGHLLGDPANRIPRFALGIASSERKDHDTVQNHPIHSRGTLKLICPVGKGSGITARAWLSASLADGSGTIRVFAQDDDSGVNDWTWNLAVHDGRSNRPWKELTDGTTQLVIQHDLTGSGTVCLETLPK